MSTTDLTTKPQMADRKRDKLRKWVIRIALALAILGPLIFILAGPAYRMGLIDLGTSLGTLSREIGPLILFAGLISGVTGLVMAFMIKPRKGLVLAAVATIIPLAGLGHLKGVKDKVSKLPYIHDITTDTQDPPLFTDTIVKLRDAGDGSNTLDYIGKKDPKDVLVSVQQTNAYPKIRPVLRSEAPDIVFGEALSLIKQQGWDIHTEDSEAGVIEATDTTFWYGFKDDVIVRVRAAEGGGTIVDMRSVSRVGMSDMGANAKRLSVLIDGLKD